MACCVVVGFAMRGAGNEEVRKYEILIELDFICAVSVNSIRSESIERMKCLVRMQFRDFLLYFVRIVKGLIGLS